MRKRVKGEEEKLLTKLNLNPRIIISKIASEEKYEVMRKIINIRYTNKNSLIKFIKQFKS